MKNCSMLAAALSAAYRSNEPFRPPLNQYLQTNGILLTMCMSYRGLIPPFLCSSSNYGEGGAAATDSDKKHVSASWIQANTTGFRVVEAPVDIGPPVGYVLNPAMVNISCMYPFDAATIQRLDNGCGAVKENSGNPITRWVRRQEIIYFKNQMFGKDTPWTSIPCTDFFFFFNTSLSTLCIIPESNETCHNMTHHNGSVRLEFISSLSYNAKIYEEWLGHPACNTTDIPLPFFDDDSFLLYAGKCSWPPEDWRSMVETMEGTLQKHPKMGVWNEIVLDMPENLDDIIQAVFYVSGGNDSKRAHGIAAREAKKRGKPLLKVLAVDERSDISRQDDLFTCVAKDDGSNEIAPSSLLKEHFESQQSNQLRGKTKM